MQAIQVQTPGGPDALQLVALPEPQAGAGTVRVRAQAIGVGRVEAGDQLFDVAVIGPRCTVGAMGIKIHDQTRNVHAPMTRRSQQRRKRAFERFQRSLDRLGDVVIGCGRQNGVSRCYRLDRRRFPERSAADQKDHKKYTAYDE